MNLLIDRRIGSADLAPVFQSKYGGSNMNIDLVDLTAGDFVFPGNGPDGSTVTVGVERKKLSDAVQSMREGRLNAQVIAMQEQRYNPIYVIIEGQWDADADGYIREFKYGRWRQFKLGRSPILYSELERFLTTLEVCAGVKLRRTLDADETATVLYNMLVWWAKPWDGHTSHLGLQKTAGQQLVRPTLLRRVAAEMPGIGDGKSRAVALHFSRVSSEHACDCVQCRLALASAAPSEWAKIEGIGMTMATRIWRGLRGH